MEGFALVFLCASNGRIREEALVLLDMIGKVFKTKAEVAVLPQGHVDADQPSNAVLQPLLSSLRVSDVVSEMSGEVRSAFVSSHSDGQRLIF